MLFLVFFYGNCHWLKYQNWLRKKVSINFAKNYNVTKSDRIFELINSLKTLQYVNNANTGTQVTVNQFWIEKKNYVWWWLNQFENEMRKNGF